MPRVKKRVEQLSLGPAPWRWEQEMSDHVAALSVSPDGAAVAIGTLAGEALVLSTSDGSVFAKLDEHPMGTLDVQWSPNGSRLASAGMDGQVQMYEVGRCDGALKITKLGSYGRKGWAQRLAWSPDGSRLAAGIGKTVTLIGADGVVIGDRRFVRHRVDRMSPAPDADFVDQTGASDASFNETTGSDRPNFRCPELTR